MLGFFYFYHMTKDRCFCLGIIVKKYSFKGELLAKLDTDQPELYENIKTVFVEINHQLIPFFLEHSKLHKSNVLRIKFEGVNSETEAENLLKSRLFLPLESLPKLEGNKFYYHEVIGFTVTDHIHGVLGKITAINDKSAQHLFEIENHEKPILIPIIDPFIQDVDRQNKMISVKTPPGLIDLYL